MSVDFYDGEPKAGGASRPEPRPHIGILFECCGVYARIYRNPGAAAYEGRCPRCLAPVRVRVDKNGVRTRQFRAS